MRKIKSQNGIHEKIVFHIIIKSNFESLIMEKKQLLKLSITLLFLLSIFTGGNAFFIPQYNLDSAYSFLPDNKKRTSSECIQSLKDLLIFIDRDENESKKEILTHSFVQTEKSYSEYQTHISDFMLFGSDSSPPKKGQDI